MPEEEMMEEEVLEEEIEVQDPNGEEVEAEAPPNEPDEPPPDEPPEEAEEEPEPIPDPPGVVTQKSEDKFKKLASAWVKAGKPRRLSALGSTWHVFDAGHRFVKVADAGGMGDYGSLSTSRF